MANFFPRWTNWIPLKVVVCVIVIACALTGATWYYATPKYTKIGYQPIQPVPFPHDIHVTQLGMDCRYCHSFVEVAAQSNVPNTATCMNCHTQVAKDNPKLQPVQESWKSGRTGRLGVDLSHGRLRLLQPLCAREPGHQLFQLPRTSQSHAGGLHRPTPQHGVVPGLPSAPRELSAAGRSGFQSRLET